MLSRLNIEVSDAPPSFRPPGALLTTSITKLNEEDRPKESGYNNRCYSISIFRPLLFVPTIQNELTFYTKLRKASGLGLL